MLIVMSWMFTLLFGFLMFHLIVYFCPKPKTRHKTVVSSSRSPPRPGYTLKSSTLPANGRHVVDYLVSNFLRLVHIFIQLVDNESCLHPKR